MAVSPSDHPSPPLPPGMVLGPDGKPCKSCTSFRSWVGVKKLPTASATSAAAASSSSLLVAPPALPDDCPPDIERLGRHTWTFLHSTASYYPTTPSPSHKSSMLSLLRSLPLLYPCHTCASELNDYMKDHPPDQAIESRESLEKYVCETHNDVNRRLGKDGFNCDKVGERWRDGWKDGRCDGVGGV